MSHKWGIGERGTSLFFILQLLSHHPTASPAVRTQSLPLQILRASSAWRTEIPSPLIPALCMSFTKNSVTSSGKTKRANIFPSHEKMSSNVTLSGCIEPLGNIKHSADKRQYLGAALPTTQGGIFQQQLKTKLDSKEQDEEAKMRKGRKHQIQGQNQNLSKWKPPDRSIKVKRERSINQKRFRIKFSTQNKQN